MISKSDFCSLWDNSSSHNASFKAGNKEDSRLDLQQHV